MMFRPANLSFQKQSLASICCQLNLAGCALLGFQIGMDSQSQPAEAHIDYIGIDWFC